MITGPGEQDQASATELDDRLTEPSRAILREVAHMLRSTLGSIVMMADTLREQGADLTPEQRERPLGIIYRAALSAAATASDLLTLTGVNGDDAQSETVEFSPAETLEVVADIVRPVTESRSCELVVAAEESLFVGRSRDIGRAMLGLALRTALRVRDGGMELVAVRDDDGRMRFSVTAWGSDVAPEGGTSELLEVFRHDPDDGSYTLSAEGLGLTAVERLVKSMGSELSVDVDTDGEIRLSFALADARRD